MNIEITDEMVERAFEASLMTRAPEPGWSARKTGLLRMRAALQAALDSPDPSDRDRGLREKLLNEGAEAMARKEYQLHEDEMGFESPRFTYVEALALTFSDRVIEGQAFWGEAWDRAFQKLTVALQAQEGTEG